MLILKILISKYFSLAIWKVDLQIGHPDARYHELPSVPAERNSTQHHQDQTLPRHSRFINTSFGDSQHT
jgi:hypothetical protein